MNQFDVEYDIRLATREDIPVIMSFIDTYWKKGHVMATSRELFGYEYVHGDEVDFIVAYKRKSGSLEAIFGFLRCSKERTGDIWGSMWKVNEDGDNMNLLGIEIAKRVYDLTGCNYYCGNGANPNTTVPLRKIFFREKTIKMEQYYWLNPDKEVFSVAVVNEYWKPQCLDDAPLYSVRRYGSFDELNSEYDINKAEGIPHKDSWYVKKRFFEHPVYHYDAYGIYNNNVALAVFFTKTILVNNSSVLRIVDYIGSHEGIRGIYNWLSETVNRNDYEYVDFFEYGIDELIMQSAGFRKREDYENIIPNYFEPFLQQNVDIWVHYKQDGTTFFKADGDQDRPNIIR